LITGPKGFMIQVPCKKVNNTTGKALQKGEAYNPAQFISKVTFKPEKPLKIHKRLSGMYWEGTNKKQNNFKCLKAKVYNGIIR